MPDSDVNRLGDAVADIYDNVRTTNKNYIDNLTGGQSDKSLGRAGGVVGTNAADMSRIMTGTGESDDEFYSDVPTKVGRNSPYSLSDNEPIGDDEVPEYDDIAEGEQQYAENDGGSGVDIDIDTPNTTKGKIISLIYVAIMLCILLFGLNFLVSRFKSPEFKEDAFNLGDAVDSVRGVNDSQAKTHEQIDNLLGVDRNGNQDGTSSQSAGNESKDASDSSTEFPSNNGLSNSDSSGGNTWNSNATVNDIITNSDKDSYSTFDELRNLPLGNIKSYNSGMEYVNWNKGLIAYSGSKGREYVTSTVHEGIIYIQLDENGILLKSPVSKSYLYVVVPDELKSRLMPEGVATIRTYESKNDGEVYVDVTDTAVIIEKNSTQPNKNSNTDGESKGNRESSNAQVPDVGQSISEMLDLDKNIFDE